jgi:predicted DNA-binding transcriptional regulator YafY
VQFGYRKPNDKGHKQRTVSPKEITTVDHRTGPDSTLCLKGYCEMRKADRVFALKRMRGLKVV